MLLGQQGGGLQWTPQAPGRSRCKNTHFLGELGWSIPHWTSCMGPESQLQKALASKVDFRRWVGLLSATHRWSWDRERGHLELVLTVALTLEQLEQVGAGGGR